MSLKTPKIRPVNLFFCISTVILAIAIAIAHVLFSQYVQQLNHRQLLLVQLKYELEEASHLSANQYLTGKKSWDQFLGNKNALLEHYQTIKYNNNGVQELLGETSLLKDYLLTLESIVKAQSQIAQQQNEFMRAQSQQESLRFRINKLLDSCKLIIGTLEKTRPNTQQIALVYKLKNVLEQILVENKIFWLNPAVSTTASKKIEQSVTQALQTAQQLLDSRTGLQTTAQRREMLEVSRDIELLSSQVQALQDTAKQIKTVANNQSEIYKLSQQILSSLQNLDLPLPNNLAVVLVYLVFIAIWLLLNKRVLTFSVTAQKNVKTADHSPPAPAKEAPTTLDMDDLIRCMDLAAKGNLSARADERQGSIRELAIAYNQVMATLYRKVVEIYRDVQTIAKSIEPTDDADNNTSQDHDKKISPLPTADWIEHTYEIAGIADQLKRKIKNPDQGAEPVGNLVSRLDKIQALLRVKIRDFKVPDITLEQQKVSDYQDLSPLVKSLEDKLQFFKLDRRT